MSKLVLPVVIEKDADGYFAFSPSLQGYAQGDSCEEALASIEDVVWLHLEDRAFGRELGHGEACG